MSDELEQGAKDLGFTDEAELLGMVAGVDLTLPMIRKAFELWKRDDGSKAGLEKALRCRVHGCQTKAVAEISTDVFAGMSLPSKVPVAVCERHRTIPIHLVPTEIA